MHEEHKKEHAGAMRFLQERRMAIAPVLALVVSVTLTSTPLSAADAPAKERDQLPLGHPDFYPSPRRPIGWRGDGNGAFPGATLAVDRFGDGRMQTASVKDKKGKTRSVLYAVGDSLNIAWKHPLPGFTMSQPIIVGDRVIQTCEPRTVLCLELKTGKELWRQELCPFKMLGLEGKELEAALLWESAAWTLIAQRCAKFGNYTRLSGTADEEWPGAKVHARSIAAVLDTLAPHYPDLVKQARQDLAKATAILDGPPDESKKKELVKHLCAPANAFTRPFQEKFGFPATAHWYSFVGWTWPTPVCDGTWLYVFMNQGQIAKLSLEDGSINWLRRISEVVPGLKQPLPRSPILHQGILYMQAADALYALEAETGKELWKCRPAGKGAYNDVISAVTMCVVRLDGGRAVLAHGVGNLDGQATQWLHLIEPKTGEILFDSGVIKSGRVEPGPSVMSEGNLLLFGNGGRAYRVEDKDGKVVPRPLWEFKGWQSGVQVLHDGRYYSNHAGKLGRDFNIFDAATGKAVLAKPLKSFGLSCYRPGILVGDRLVGSFSPDKSQVPKIEGAYRFAQRFAIATKDGRIISDDNVLEIASEDDAVPMPVPQAAPFLGKFLTSEQLGQINAGIPPTFGWGGMYAQGERLLIPSTKYLYCIGNPSEPYNGKPGPER